MSGIFSQDKPKTFQCLNCGEVINTAMTECAFCGVTLDSKASLATADFQKTLDNACTEARTLKIMALVLVVGYLAVWLPVISNNAIVFFLILFILIPIMLVRWWMVYSRIESKDEPYRKAQRDLIIAMVVWGVMGSVWLAVVLIRTFVLAGKYSD